MPLRLTTADGHTIELPVTIVGSDRFMANQPGFAEELDITEVRLFGDEVETSVRFMLETFVLVEGEAGTWTIAISEDALGVRHFDLEYVTTERFGRKVRYRTVMHWNDDKSQMTTA